MLADPARGQLSAVERDLIERGTNIVEVVRPRGAKKRSRAVLPAPKVRAAGDGSTGAPSL